MEITVKLTNQDVALANTSDLVALTKYLQGIAAEAEGKTARQEAPAKEPEPVKKQEKKEAAPMEPEPEKEEPAKEKISKEAHVKTEKAPEPEPVTEEVPAEPEPEPEKEAPKAKVIDLSEMKKRVMAIKDADADKWDGIKNLIKQYGNGKLSAIPEDDREAFMEAVEAL